MFAKHLTNLKQQHKNIPMQLAPQHPHLARLYTALADELATEADAHQRLLRMPLADRIAAGVTWPSLQLHSVDNPGWARWIQVGLRTTARLSLHDGISPGDLVTVAPIATPDRGIEGRCVFAEGDFAEIRLHDQATIPGWLEGGHVAVTRGLDPTTNRRYRDALMRADQHDSRLRDALLSGVASAPEQSASVQLRGLNLAQQHAGAAALAAPALSMIHGPPGTGKTTLMVGLLKALVSAGERPWALADSNAAVDHLAARAAAAGLGVLRLGARYRIGPAAQDLSFAAHMARSSMAPALKALEAELVRLPPKQRRPLYRQRRALLDQIRRQVITDSQVIAATLGTMSREAASLPPAAVALVDEATQAIEPAIWSIVPAVERLILLGDPEQLGPVVHTPGSPLGTSLLARLLDAGLPAPMLEEQYRMSAPLCALVSGTYGPAYRPHPAVAAWCLTDLPDVSPSPLTSRSVLWVDTAGGGLEESRDPVTLSLFNAGEAELVVKVTADLLAAGVSADQIGIIAPYSAQVARLREALPDIEVATVNAFQGREQEVIICSFVRSNDDGELGFVSDPRRLVVAVTRAKRLLVCIGDAGTLSSSTSLATLMDAVQQVDSSAWQSVWEPPWDAVLSA